MSCYAKYWIYVCGGMFIMVSFAGKLVGYKIIYMLLFLLCLCLYQVCRRHQSRGSHSEVLLIYDPHHQLLAISILQHYFIGPTATSYVCSLLLLSTLHTQTNMSVTQGQPTVQHTTNWFYVANCPWSHWG